jgi:hypothetical protein
MRAGRRRYSVRIEAPASPDAKPVTHPSLALEGAWAAGGLIVRRKRTLLVVAAPGVEPAIVPLPTPDRFGSEPFVILCGDPVTLGRMLDLIAPLFGVLICTSSAKADELRVGVPR